MKTNAAVHSQVAGVTMTTRIDEMTGFRDLFRKLDKIVAATDDVQQITAEIRDLLSASISSDQLDLGDEFCEVNAESYGRRLLYSNEPLGLSVVAMIWGPGQGTPLHDHGGIWCVEAVLRGHIVVEQYRLVERELDRFRFEKESSVRAGMGEAGHLIPPHEYHTITNDIADASSVTIHVYGGEITRCMIFKPQEKATWFIGESSTLDYR